MLIFVEMQFNEFFEDGWSALVIAGVMFVFLMIICIVGIIRVRSGKGVSDAAATAGVKHPISV